MNIQAILAAAAAIADCHPQDFGKPVTQVRKPKWTIAKRALVIAMQRLGFTDEIIGRHVAYSMGTISYAGRHWIREPGVAEAVEEILAAPGVKSQRPKAAPQSAGGHASVIWAGGATLRRHPQTREIIWSDRDKPFARHMGRPA